MKARDERWVRQCMNKRRFETRIEAKRAQKKIRRFTGDKRLGIYPCDYCSNWHLGHPPGEGTGRRKEWRSGDRR